MELPSLGVNFLEPEVEAIAAPLDGPPLVIYDDPERTAEAMRGRSAKDAAAYPEYRAAMEQIARVVGSVLGSPPPDIDDPGPRDLWNVLGVGRSFRGLGTRNGYRLLRWAPMPVADLTREWFESELLCASIAGPAVSGAMMGPRSAGSGLVLLLQEAHRLLAGGSFRARGGPGAMTVGNGNRRARRWCRDPSWHDGRADHREGRSRRRGRCGWHGDPRDRRRIRGGPKDNVPATHGRQRI